MKVIVFQEEAYYEMLEKLMNRIEERILELIPKQEKEWIKEEEAKELLGFKSKTKLQQLRDESELDFSQHGRTILYSRSSIKEFIERNRKGWR